jgi:hypothetical protein
MRGDLGFGVNVSLFENSDRPGLVVYKSEQDGQRAPTFGDNLGGCLDLYAVRAEGLQRLLKRRVQGVPDHGREDRNRPRPLLTIARALRNHSERWSDFASSRRWLANHRETLRPACGW